MPGSAAHGSAAQSWEIIDADGHVYEPDEELFEYLGAPYAGQRTVLGFPFWPSLDGFQRGAIYARLDVHTSFKTDARMWLEFLDQAGIGATVLYPTAALACGLIRDREWAIALARAYNNWLFDRYLTASPRLNGMALLPLQEPPAAVQELRRAVTELRMVGGVLPAVGLRKPLGDSEFHPLYAEAERLGCALAVHGGPAHALGLEVLDRFAQVHTLSHPFAQMLQLTSIVMSGILDLFPGLRWAFLEAGAGWVPFIMDRMDRSYEGRKHHDYIGGVRHRPSTYIKSGKVFFTADPTERTLAYAAGVIAADALIFASDFPHETNLASCRRDIETLGNASDLSLETRRKILGVNARRLYQLGGA